jgi:UDP-N-acetylglucosamine 4-epimerase
MRFPHQSCRGDCDGVETVVGLETVMEDLTADQRWLVTGAAGFIGSHLVADLLHRGQEVVGLDNFATGHRKNLDQVREEVGNGAWERFTLIEGDIRDLATCTSAVQGADYVLHQAAIGSVPRSIKDPLTTHTVNVDGTMNMFLAAIECGTKKVVFASSSSVYGDDARLPKVENQTGTPLSPYAVGKQAGELYAHTLSQTHGLASVGLRYFNVVGPRQDPDGPYAAVVPKWVAALCSGDRPVIYGNGETTRDFSPVANVVSANLLAAVSGDATNGNVYNVALGGSTTLNELFMVLRDALAAKGVDCGDIEPIYEDFRPGDIRDSLADSSKAANDFGYAPDVTLKQGIAKVVESALASGAPC